MFDQQVGMHAVGGEWPGTLSPAVLATLTADERSPSLDSSTRSPSSSMYCTAATRASTLRLCDKRNGTDDCHRRMQRILKVRSNLAA